MKRFVCILALSLLPSILWLTPADAASTNDFTITSFTADYYLSRDEQKISHLKVEEQIVATFPNFNQNHGILRAIPKTYKGHSLDLTIQKITNTAGVALPYETSESNDNLVLKIGDADRYVQGAQTYFITYTMSNVTSNFDNHDEFYWDSNGDQWLQSTGYVSTKVHFDEGLEAQWTAPYAACYQGSKQQSSPCRVFPPGHEFVKGDKNVVGFEANGPLGANQTLTAVIAFKKDTFAPYQMPLQTLMLIILVGFAPPIVMLLYMLRKWLTYGRDPRGKGVIVPQYLPPKDISVLGSSVILKEGFQPTALSAQIIDLAVRHYVKVYEVVKNRRLLPDKTHYEIELVKLPEALRAEELAVLNSLFGDQMRTGDRINIKDLNHKLYKKATTLGKQLEIDLTAQGYFKQAPAKVKTPYLVVGTSLLIIGFIGIPWTLGLMVAGLIIMIGALYMPARTQKGVESRDYLLGLKLYMKLAEAERLKMLQSPHGTLTEKVNIGDNGQLVKLYEKLLPYAMLFGIEKDWAQQFAALYTESPAWYSGSQAFQAAYFASALHDFSSAANSTFVAPSNSSSSGFGGGFAGGGGGGGGGGGW